MALGGERVCAVAKLSPPFKTRLSSPRTALRRRDRVATGTMWEGRAAPVVRFGPVPAGRASGVPIRPPDRDDRSAASRDGLKGGVQSAGFGRHEAAPCRRVEIGDRKTPCGAPEGRHYYLLRGTPEAPRSLLMREEAIELFDSLGLTQAAGTKPHAFFVVIAGLDPAIHSAGAASSDQAQEWMPGSSPGMTISRKTVRMMEACTGACMGHAPRTQPSPETGRRCPPAPPEGG